MPGYGEAVGDIYVRAHVDGRAMDRELARSIGSVDGDKEGERLGKDWSDGYIRTVDARVAKARKRANRESYNSMIGNAKKTAVQTSLIWDRNFFKKIEADIRRHYPMEGIADRMVGDLKKAVERSGLGEKFFAPDMVGDEEVEAEVDKFLKNLSKNYARYRDQQEKENADFLKRTLANVDKTLHQRERMEFTARARRRAAEKLEFDLQVKALEGTERLNKHIAQVQEKRQRELARIREKGIRDFETSFKRLEEAYRRVGQGNSNIGESFSASVRRTKDHVRELREELERVELTGGRRLRVTESIRAMDRDLERLNPRFRLLHRNLDRTASRIGLVFGRRSRNDALHFFGMLTEGMTRLVFSSARLAEGIFKAGKGVVNFGMEVVDAVREAQSVFEGVEKVSATVGGRILSMGSAFASAAPAIGAFGAGAVVLVAVLGVLTAAASGLVAALTALAGTLVLGVIGTLAAVGGAILPVAAGIGVLVAGIMSMSDHAKKALKNSLKPLGDEFKRLGRIGAGEIFKNAGDQAKGMSKAIKSAKLDTLVRDIGKSISGIGDSWVDAISGPGFKNFIRVMEKNLPKQITALGEIMKNTFSGMGSLFIALQPLVNRFLGWMEQITARFASWAQSAQGQSALKRFFQDVGDAAAGLGRVIGAIGIALGDLFRAGNKTGISIFDDIAKQFRNLSEYIRKNPDAVGEWFDHGLRTIRSVGHAIQSIIEVIKALDTPANRSAAVAIFEFMAGAIRGTVGLIKGIGVVVAEIFAGISYAIGGLLDGMGAVFGALGHLPGFGWAKDAGKALDGMSDSAYNLAKRLQGVDSFSDITIDVDDKGTIKTRKKALEDFFTVAQDKANQGVEFEVTDNGSTKKTFDSIKAFFDYVEEKNQGNFLNNVAKGLTDGINDAIGHATGQLKTLSGIMEETLGNIPPADITVNPRGFQETMDLTDLVTQGLGHIPRRTDATVSDKGTAKPLFTAFDRIRSPLESVQGNHSSKLKGTISPADYGSRISSIASALSRAAGTFVGSYIGRAIKQSMAGRIANSYTFTSLAEDGKAEAVVPLERPLALVDPAVRDIAAFAQGKLKPTVEGTGKSIDASGWTVVSQSKDPEAVATEVLNEIVGKLL